MRSGVKIALVLLAVLIGLSGWKGLNALLYNGKGDIAVLPRGEQDVTNKIQKTNKEWKKSLNNEQYWVLRECGTEKPFSGKYNDHWEEGTYVCAGCGTPLFESDSKYEHGTGWPSFTMPVDDGNLEYQDDYSLLMKRIEVRCVTCGGHLGHVFDDGPAPTYLHYCVNSAALDFIPQENRASNGEDAPAPQQKRKKAATKQNEFPNAKEATFAAGCFWGVEFKFGKLPGVLSTTVGYAGGKTKNPTYKQVCSDKTGHAESVRVVFDPAQISYEELVRYFFGIHDPTQVNRQGPDRGTQYRGVIFYHDEEQKEIAQKVIEEVNASDKYKKPLATELVPVPEFYKAEEYHQKYYQKNGIIRD